MLKDSLQTYQTPSVNDLSVAPNLEVDKILSFIDKNISAFPPYYQSVIDSVKENRITDILIHHFELCKNETGGYLPFRFSKNPTQQESDKETDIGVFVMTRNQIPLPIIEFESKRLSKSSNNKEYVCGIRGGIERFKRGQHSSHLKVCGMFGYIQYHNSADWINKINYWITDLTENNIDPTIVWKDNDELLIKVGTFSNVEKLKSSNYRITTCDRIAIWHYMIELGSKD